MKGIPIALRKKCMNKERRVIASCFATFLEAYKGSLSATVLRGEVTLISFYWAISIVQKSTCLEWLCDFPPLRALPAFCCYLSCLKLRVWYRDWPNSPVTPLILVLTRSSLTSISMLSLRDGLSRHVKAWVKQVPRTLINSLRWRNRLLCFFWWLGKGLQDEGKLNIEKLIWSMKVWVSRPCPC